MDLQHKLGAELDKGQIVGVEIAEDIGGVKAALHEEGGHTVGLGVGGVVAEAARIRDHARVEELGGHGRDGEPALLGEGGDKTAAALKGGVGDLTVADGLHENVVIHAGGVGGGGVALVADESLGGGVQHQSQRALVGLVGDLVHRLVHHKGIAVAHVAHREDLLVGEGILQNMAQTQLTAQGIAVGVLMAMDDDARSLADQLRNLFKHMVCSVLSYHSSK